MLLELMADIVDERGLGHLGERLLPRFEPAGEVEQVKGVGAERVEGELTEALGIEEDVRPVQFSSLLVAKAIRRSAGRQGR
jgi:hypothetical protein